MNSDHYNNQPAVIYFTVLIVLEVLIFAFMMLADEKQFVMYNIMRVLLLIGAHCTKSMAWAAYYTVFALIASLYIFDPVGLWVTGHGQQKTKLQNGMAALAFLSTLVAVFLGYMYKTSLEKQVFEDFVGDAFPRGYTNPNQNNRFMYRQAQNQQNQQNNNYNRGFQQFSGQAYSLD